MGPEPELPEPSLPSAAVPPPSGAPGPARRRGSWLIRMLDGAKGRALLLAEAAIARLPLARAVRLGGRVGRAFARVHGPRTATARTNLRLAFPELAPEARERLLRDVYANLGRVVAETALLGRLRPDELLSLADVEGLEALETARAAHPWRGAIVLTGHFGSFELFAAIMAAHGIPLSIVHRTSNTEVLDRMLTERRAAQGIELIRRDSAARAVLRALRAGRVVVMPLDQNTGLRDGVFTSFFGRPACTRDGPARLAMRTHVPVVPAFMFRIGDTWRHRVCIGKPLSLEPGADDPEQNQAAIQRNVGRMTAAIEEAIRLAPEQWIWNHRRWKTTPDGLSRLYPPKGSRPLRRLRNRLGIRRHRR